MGGVLTSTLFSTRVGYEGSSKLREAGSDE